MIGQYGMGVDRRTVLGGTAATLAVAMARSGVAASVDGDGSGSAVVQTSYGALRGTVEDGINVFRGIPYGAPTGGNARFMPPQPPRPWKGVREAKQFGAACPQLEEPLPPYLRTWWVDQKYSENCLVLNVWTPGVSDRKKRPVMVWIHGGGYSTGSGASPPTYGVRLCQRGDVVVVTVNHRLNVFGYLYLAQLGGVKYADSGNLGQLDLIAALQWVRDNIEGFGGDPDQVMIFGESGGGGKVSTLLAMPAAKGLFHRAAIQSGPALDAMRPDEASVHAQAVMKAFGGTVDDLAQAPVDRLLAAMKAAQSDDATFRLGPVLDGLNLLRDPFTPSAPRVSADVPIIVGYNAAETTLFSPPADFSLDWAGLKRQLAPSLAGVNADALIAHLRRLRPGASASDIFFLITAERWMCQRSITLAERKAALCAAPAYLYRLEFETPVENLRAAHSLDVPLVFDTVGASLPFYGSAADDAQKVAEQMSAAWIAFARTGSPNAPGLTTWPKYDAISRSTMIFNVASRPVDDPYSEERRLIANLPPTNWLGVLPCRRGEGMRTQC